PAPPRRNRQLPGRAWTRRPRNFGRAKVGCYDETAVLKGLSVEPSVRHIPLGGLVEIGLKMMLIESCGDDNPVDIGRLLPDRELADTRRFAELGEQGVAVLCSDSTNVDRPGHTRSEIEVGAALAERFDRATGRIILATFASHIHRIQQVLTLAAARRRRVALLGRSMEKNVAIASELGYLRVPSGLLAPLEEMVALPPERQVILSTGSQGEPNSALALMAAGEHKYVQIARGDLVVISARVIPGHERTVGRVINALYRLGAEVLYEDNAFVHVSGHASQEDLKLML